MTLKQKLETISVYIITSRQVGHTTLMRQGFDNFPGDKFILSKTMKDGNRLRCLQSQVVSLESLEKLRGHDWPLVIDNHALVELFRSAVLELSTLEEDLNEANRKIKQLEYGNFIKNTSRRTGRDERRGIESRSPLME